MAGVAVMVLVASPLIASVGDTLATLLGRMLAGKVCDFNL